MAKRKVIAKKYGVFIKGVETSLCGRSAACPGTYKTLAAAQRDIDDLVAQNSSLTGLYDVRPFTKLKYAKNRRAQ